MKYLVTFKRRDSAPVPVQAISGILAAQRDWMQERSGDGTFEAAYGFPQGGGGIVIVNADSPEELSELLIGSPAFALTDLSVQPLVDIEVSLGNSIRALQQFADVPA